MSKTALFYANKITGEYLGSFDGETGVNPSGPDVIEIPSCPDDARQKWNAATKTWSAKPIDAPTNVDPQKLVAQLKIASPVALINLKVSDIVGQ